MTEPQAIAEEYAARRARLAATMQDDGVGACLVSVADPSCQSDCSFGLLLATTADLTANLRRPEGASAVAS